MGQFFNSTLAKITAGAGFVLVAALISFGIWQWQGGDDSQQTPEASQDVSNGLNLPGFPIPNNRPAVSDDSESDASVSDASVGDSVDLVSQRERTNSDNATVGDSSNLQTTGSAPGATVGDSASIGGSVQTQIQAAQAPPSSGGGPSAAAAVQDTAVLVVESASGEIKSQETVK